MRARATILSRQRVYIPFSGRLPAGLWMHAACRPVTIAANNLVGHLARVSVRLVPSRSTQFVPWIPAPPWLRIASALGLREGDFVAFRPSDPRRARMLLLTLDQQRRPVLLAKISKLPPNPLADLALSRLQGNTNFRVPKVRDVWEEDGWWISIEDPLPPGPHRPSRLTPVERVGLCSAIAESVPEHASATEAIIHGDFAPWNVREFAKTGLAILDWDDACRGPRASDALWYAMSSRLIRKYSQRRVFSETVRELSEFYPPDDLVRAANFWLNRWTAADSAEVIPDIPKSKSLLALEIRRNRVLEQMANLSSQTLA